jgi:hypothetical protein
VDRVYLQFLDPADIAHMELAATVTTGPPAVAEMTA